MDDLETRLDGNSAAGLLSQVFVEDVTVARGACRSCGKVSQVGASHAYMNTLAPGAVLRCSTCESALVVLVELGGKLRLGMPGLAWLEVELPPLQD
jgi:hypothetical protein